MTQQPLQLPANTQMLLVCLLSFCFSAVLYPGYIRWLKKKQVEQYLREEGPKSHAHKAKTPTMGGVIFSLVVPAVSFAAWGLLNPGVAPTDFAIFAVALACALIGFIDDYAKVAQKSNKGISGRVRLLSEIMLGAALGALLLWTARQMIVTPFAETIASILGGRTGGDGNLLSNSIWVPHWLLFIPLSSFLIAATSNSLNLHDGMDGLAAGTSAQVFATMALMLFATGQFSFALVAASAAGAICAFLLFNKNPAQIFMGDTGSLFIGGLMGALVMAGGLVVWFIPLSLVYILESVSVLAQVSYFKLTKHLEGQEKMPVFKVAFVKLTKRLPGEGKRIFRMAPLHHHYEAVLADKGIPEWQVVALFWLAQSVLCLTILAVFFACNGI